MTVRKTIRPTTIRRVVDYCRLMQNGKTSINQIAKALSLSNSRVNEVARELQVMNLLSIEGDQLIPNQNTFSFLENFEKENWQVIHHYFFTNYPFYRTYINLLEKNLYDEHGMSFDSLQTEATELEFNLNRTAIEVLSDWCDRLGIIQRNLYTGRIYLVKTKTPNITEFKNSLILCFNSLVSNRKPREVYAEIPKLREGVCELMKLKRELFDSMLGKLYLENIGKIELCSAPITTFAKKSPLSEKQIEPYSKNGVLAPRFLLRKEREGLAIKNKAYYYIAIHKNI